MYFTGGIVGGVIVFFLAPIVASGLRASWGDSMAQRYYRLGMALLGRGLLIKRKHGGYWLKASSFDSKHGKEKTKISGETKHFEDPENLMSRLYGWPFAIAHEKSETITDARYSEVGEVFRDWKRKGIATYDDGNETYVNGYVPVASDETRLVNPDHALALASGDADPGTTDWATEITKQLLQPFKDANYLDWITGLMVAGGAWGMCWAAYQVLGSTGGGSAGRTIGLFITGGML